jgi:hypothetical protein
MVRSGNLELLILVSINYFKPRLVLQQYLFEWSEMLDDNLELQVQVDGLLILMSY